MRAILATMLLDLSRIVRHVRYIVVAVALPVGFYILYSEMYGGQQSFEGTTWGLYYLISMITFSALATNLNLTGTQIALDRSVGWTRFLRLTPLKPWQYVFSKLAASMLASFVVMVLVVLTSAFITRVPFGGSAEVLACLYVWLGSTCFAAIGLTLAYVMDAQSITYGTVILYLGMSFLGGLWTPLKFLPSAIQSIAHVLPTYQVAQIAWTTLAHHTPQTSNVLVVLLYVVAFGALGGYLYGRSGETLGR